MTKKIVLLTAISFVGLYAGCPLINVRKKIPSLCYQMRYATPHNITGRLIRNSNACYLRAAPARALKAVQEELEPMGYCLKIWDAYQPYSEQREVCRIMKEMCVDCDQIPGDDGHCRGYAVDVTLVRDCVEVDMGTDFDDASPKARRSPKPDRVEIDVEANIETDDDLAIVSNEKAEEVQPVAPEALQNRELLRCVMEAHGFQADAESWWHFDYQGWETKPVLDIPFSELK